DQFWALLIQLSRDDGVTIFISTHFMNEAERCDRISLMHAGRVLAQGCPAALIRERGAENLEETFIGYLQQAAASEPGLVAPEPPVDHPDQAASPSPRSKRLRLDPSRAWAYARRESLEIIRDPIRIAFALLGPIMLMIAFGYGITFDLEEISYAALDQDQTPASRRYLENFAGSRYFSQRPPLHQNQEMETQLRKGRLSFVIEIPPGFGKDLTRNRQPQVAIWLDGTLPFRAETVRGYILGVHQLYLEQRMRTESGQSPPPLPVSIETRFRYNQDFKSVYAIVPGTLMLLLVWIPAMMTAAGVVREKEMGSITNLYATPVSGLEFLLGKQAPYVLIALLNFSSLLLLAVWLFQVPIKGSSLALLAGGLLYVIATTGLGLLVSSFMKTQIAAIFGTAIITTMPAVNFSGYFAPVASLTPGAQLFSHFFPSGYFQQISLGTFTKALGFEALTYNFGMLALLILVYLLLALKLLKTQER
ncbi:MAG: ABC transporter permease, partial [Halopseudomonas sp.]